MSISELFNKTIKKAQKYQSDLLNTFPKRGDAILQLVEALAANQHATSLVELSESPIFQRTHSNVSKALNAMSETESIAASLLDSISKDKAFDKAIAEFQKRKQKWIKIFYDLLPTHENQQFRSFVLDATSTPKKYSETLEDRTYVYQSGTLGTPAQIGIQGSVLVALPPVSDVEGKWVLPLSIERISSGETATEVATKQLQELSRITKKQGSKGVIDLILVDSGYTGLQSQSDEQVCVARGRADRTGRRPYVEKQNEEASKKGRPKKYAGGVIHFAANVPMGDENGPDEEVEHEMVYQKQEVIAFTSRWKGVYVQGHTELVDVVKVEMFLKSDSTKMLFTKALLLIVSGKRRAEVTSVQALEEYIKRFDIEHFFRFGKQKLLFNKCQTTEIQRQINWWWVCLMAYWLLYLVREIAPESRRPWDPKRPSNRTATPSGVKKVFLHKIFPELGSPSKKPISRGKSKGRTKGTQLKKRTRQKPIRKSEKKKKQLKAV